jgi:hypothetical protein
VQVLPAAWVAEASARQVDNGPNQNPDWEQGYGYQFWRCRHNAYRGDGAFGQYCVVLPDQDAVLAITGGVGDMQAVLDAAWTHLLPAMGRYPLHEDAEAHAALDLKLNRLALAPPQGDATSPVAAQVSGRTYRFEPNRQGITSLRLDFGDGETGVTSGDGKHEFPVTCGYGAWRTGEMAFGSPDGQPSPVAAAGAWTRPDTYTAQFRFYETPFCVTTTYRFTDGTVVQQSQQNVSFGPTKGPRLVGRTA